MIPKNLIFDLGGVLYDIDYECVERGFAQLQTRNVTTVRYTRQVQPEVFTQYEIGAISSSVFCEGLRREIGLEGTDEAIATAWNSMLLGVFPGRIEMLERLKTRFPAVLLSNTNELHINYVQHQCRELFAQFDRLFLSYQMGFRKPQPAIFYAVLDTMGWKAEETLFVDDSSQHIHAAQSLGIHTVWLQSPDALEYVAEQLLADGI